MHDRAAERTDPPLAADEPVTLTAFLEYLRGTIEVKTAGFDDAALRRMLEPSDLTLGGLLLHLAFVEDYWLVHIFAGREPSEPWCSAPWHDDADFDWHRIADVSGEDARRTWREAVARSRAVAAAAPSLDALARHQIPTGDDGATAAPSLRWILVHLIEEYARHAGHADLIAQSIDGRVGE